MTIQHKQTGTKAIFYVEADGKQLAELAYTKPSEDKMIIEHTEVDESLEGKGVGKDLVYHAVEFARANHLKVIPLCPFAKAMFDRKPELRDVLI